MLDIIDRRSDLTGEKSDQETQAFFDYVVNDKVRLANFLERMNRDIVKIAKCLKMSLMDANEPEPW
jgi:hypothetical protein